MTEWIQYADRHLESAGIVKANTEQFLEYEITLELEGLQTRHMGHNKLKASLIMYALAKASWFWEGKVQSYGNSSHGCLENICGKRWHHSLPKTCSFNVQWCSQLFIGSAFHLRGSLLHSNSTKCICCHVLSHYPVQVITMQPQTLNGKHENEGSNMSVLFLSIFQPCRDFNVGLAPPSECLLRYVQVVSLKETEEAATSCSCWSGYGLLPVVSCSLLTQAYSMEAV